MWRRRYEEDLQEEFRAHLEIEIAQLMERGSTREQAEREARRRFGNQALSGEVTRATRRFTRLERLWQDLRYAARVLRRSPGFTAATVLSLALGIGASTAVFSIADTVYLRPLPYAHPERLTWVGMNFPSLMLPWECLLSPDYVAWRRDNQVFQQLAATQANGTNIMVRGGREPMEVHVARVSYNFLSTFAIAPALGRDFLPEEELPDGPKAALLTHRFWRDEYRARRDIIGSVMTLDGQGYTVAGVLPASFVFPMDVKLDLLTTLPVPPSASHHDRLMGTWAVYGRLKPGVTLARAKADVERLFAASKADAPQVFRADTNAVAKPLQEHRVGDARLLVRILIGAVACLLLIACANVANLLLARWSARARELAVRAAIGASRGRLVRQLFTETALLTALGCLLGMVFVAAALRGFVHYAAGELPRLQEVAVDSRVLAIALAVSALTALVFSGLPVLRAGRIDIQSVLQQAGRRGVAGGHRLVRRGLVAAEIALSIVLLSGAALMLQTLWHMRNDHLGFQPEHSVAVSIPLRTLKLSPAAREALTRDLLIYLQRTPGAQAAAIAQCTPLTGGPTLGTFSRSDRPMPEPFHRGDNITICGAGPGYFQAAGMRLTQGRAFTSDDFHHPGTVALINQAAAKAYFPGESPLGRQIGGQLGVWKTVVGVVADSKNHGLNQPAIPEMFVNDIAPRSSASDLQFLARTLADPRALAADLHAELRAHHPGLFAKVQSMDEAIREMTASPRFNSLLLSSFAAVAFLMAVVGVYGVLAFLVTERTQEIGIRMALGASQPGVVAWVVREGILLAAAGSVAGVGGALLLTRYLRTLLYGIGERDPATFAVVVAGLGLAAAAASLLPARRAAAVDPMVALRIDG
jgi:putative ABC transport system permease protein